MRHIKDPRFQPLFDALPADVRAVADRNFALLKRDPKHPSLHFKVSRWRYVVDEDRPQVSSSLQSKARIASNGTGSAPMGSMMRDQALLGAQDGGKLKSWGRSETPEDVAKVKESYTGRYLRELLVRRAQRAEQEAGGGVGWMAGTNHSTNKGVVSVAPSSSRGGNQETQGLLVCTC